jgi:hypothetical protein
VAYVYNPSSLEAEMEIGRIMVWSQPEQILLETSSKK